MILTFDRSAEYSSAAWREREMSVNEIIKEEGMTHQTEKMKEIGTGCMITETRGMIIENGEMITETGEVTTETGENTAIRSRWVMATTRIWGGMRTRELPNT
jgi:hypothetical protein